MLGNRNFKPASVYNMRFRQKFKKIISPFWRLVFYLVLIPMLELSILVFCCSTWFLLLSVLVSGLVGVFLAYREGLRSWIELNRCLDQGDSPTVPTLHGVLILSAALFMIIPGLLTSLFGLFLLFPLTRSFVVSYLVLQFNAIRLRTQKGNTPYSPEIIDIT